MHIVDFDASLIGSGRLFPPSVEQRGWIGYHATSAFHAPGIEANGFATNKVISDECFRLLEALAQRFALDYRSVEGFQRLQSVSFSPVSELCLLYTGPSMLGGQGLGFVDQLVTTILQHPSFSNQLDPKQLLTSAKSEIAAIRGGHPVIYAADLHGQSGLEYQTVTKAVHSSSVVPPTRIVAKMELPRGDYSLLVDAPRLRGMIDTLFWGQGSTHYITLLCP